MILVPHGAAAGGNAGQAANAAMACADCAGRILRCRVDSSRGNLSGPAPAASRRGGGRGSRGRLLARVAPVSRGGAGILISWPLFLLICSLRSTYTMLLYSCAAVRGGTAVEDMWQRPGWLRIVII